MTSIFLIAGEPSGDLLGGRLIEALRRARPDVSLSGIGGPLMEAAGLTSLFPMRELSVMGVAEVARHLPRLRRRILETAAAVRRTNPDLLVTIDAPDFSFRVARRVRGSGPALVHYVAPTVWAWRPGRARMVARFLDHMLTLLPFEPPYFEAHGLAATSVGHPLVEAERPADGAAFRARHGIDAGSPLLLLLPGSRAAEVRHMLPIYLRALALLAPAVPGLRVVLPVVDAVAPLVRSGIAEAPLPVLLVGQAEKAAAFAAADAALATSGTVALELGLAGVPAVIAYAANRVTASVAKLLVRTRFASLVNLLVDREAQPEFIQEAATPQALAGALLPLFRDQTARAAQREAGETAARLLGRGGPRPSDRAAAILLEIADRRSADAVRTA